MTAQQFSVSAHEAQSSLNLRYMLIKGQLILVDHEAKWPPRHAPCGWSLRLETANHQVRTTQ